MRSLAALLILVLFGCSTQEVINLEPGSRIVLLGNNLGSRMMDFGYFESELHARYPDHHLFIRNMSDGGNTPGFRPHSGRNDPWAFEGAESFHDELANPSGSIGHLETPDEWLTNLKPDIIVAFFGFSESFEGPGGLDNYKNELTAFIQHTKSQPYNGVSAPRLVVVSPIAYQDISDEVGVPSGEDINKNLRMYTEAMREVCKAEGVRIIDVYHPSSDWMTETITIDGSQLNDEGYQRFSLYLADELFGSADRQADYASIHSAVMEKNWLWHNYYKIPNGVHVFGRRFEPYGPDNYPDELIKLREMTAIRDTAIWRVAVGETMDIDAADAKTHPLPPVETNYAPEGFDGDPRYLYGQEAIDKFTLPPGYEVRLFASEKEFPELANPVQLSFDNKGRLWVAVMPTYPHYRPGDPKPNDKLLILEDTDGDGKADKQTVFADKLHLPIGFELAEEGVYISQAPHLKLLIDDDGDDRMDREEILLSGFDDHDTHHAISAFAADPSGAIYMGEGVFLHTNVETSYGPVRGTNGGFYRYAPQRHHLERTAQVSIPNPWGIAFDRWGQNFYAETSGPVVSWMMPASMKTRYGIASPKSPNIIEKDHMVRPTSGLEFVSSRHFPDEVQGDLLIGNAIGFLGLKQHEMIEDGTGFTSKHRHDLIQSSDPNFRPVDMEFAPDGSLYLIDWHNVLIGHMQHNARDPLRDHVHGRIYRITYPSRPLVTPATIDGASLDILLNNLKLPEFRSRYRTRRELRGRSSSEVLPALKQWVANLDASDPDYDHHRLEALWVTWGLNQVDEVLLNELLESGDHRVRAAAVRVARYSLHQVDALSIMKTAAADEHGRVRLEAAVAASWMPPTEGEQVLQIVSALPTDRYMLESIRASEAHLAGINYERPPQPDNFKDVAPELLEVLTKGREIYRRDAHCATCHQEDGGGLVASSFPPLAGTDWVLGDKDRLIKIALHGMAGPIEVQGRTYPGQVPMTPFKGLLNDEEMAAVLTYVRKAFGNDASIVTPEDVARVRAETEDRNAFYAPSELD